MAVLLDDQTPPVVEFAKVVVEPAQTVFVPVLAPKVAGFTQTQAVKLVVELIVPV